MSLMSLLFLPFFTFCPGVILPFLTLFEATSNARFSPLTVITLSESASAALSILPSNASNARFFPLTLLGGAANASAALSIFPPSTL